MSKRDKIIHFAVCAVMVVGIYFEAGFATAVTAAYLLKTDWINDRFFRGLLEVVEETEDQ